MSTKVLIVDDNKDIVKLIRRRLKKRGYEIYDAENGETGMKSAMELMPDMVLMDMHMPVMDGHAATKKLREEAYKGLIIALTASAMSSEVSKTKESGCDYFISKPIDNDFEDTLARILSERTKEPKTE